MKFDLARLPKIDQWAADRARKIKPGTVLFAVAGVFLLFGGLAPQGAELAKQIPGPALKPPLSGAASAIVSGDTLIVGGSRVQLWGIVAARPGSADGAQAQAYLTALVDTHQLTCQDTGQRSYDRIIARCVDPWSRDIAELMVRAGWAHDLAEFSRGQYAPAEEQAETLGVGVFRGNGAIGLPLLPDAPPMAFAAPSSPDGAYVVPPIAALQ